MKHLKKIENIFLQTALRAYLRTDLCAKLGSEFSKSHPGLIMNTETLLPAIQTNGNLEKGFSLPQCFERRRIFVKSQRFGSSGKPARGDFPPRAPQSQVERSVKKFIKCLIYSTVIIEIRITD